MKRAALLLFLLAACKKPVPTPEPDAGPAVATVATVDAGIPDSAEELTLVAESHPHEGSDYTLIDLGTRVALANDDIVAMADGDGPLALGRGPLPKLPHTKKQYIHLVGRWPHLVAIRHRRIEQRGESTEPVAFVYDADEDGGAPKWRQAEPVPDANYETALVPYQDGAVVVNGAYMVNNGNIGWYPGTKLPSNSLTFIAPTGKVKRLTTDIPTRFVPWDASSDGKTLTLVGTTIVPELADKTNPYRLVDTLLLRIDASGVRTTTLDKRPYEGNKAPKGSLHQHDGRIIVSPPGDESPTWPPLTARIVEENGDVVARTFPADGQCWLSDVQSVGTTAYAIRSCSKDNRSNSEVLRVDTTGKTERIRLPKLESFSPSSLLVRDPGDLWVVGGNRVGALVLLRLGHPQTPLAL